MGWYYEDFEVGRTIVTQGRTITEADIGNFAGLAGDFNPLHTDEVFAQGTDFGGRIAHGPMVIGMAFGLGSQAGLFNETVLGLLGVQWTFKTPVKAGDTLRVAVSVLERRLTNKPDRGVVSLRMIVRNQHDAEVQLGECQLMVRRRVADEARYEPLSQPAPSRPLELLRHPELLEHVHLIDGHPVGVSCLQERSRTT